jgi:hypothetical protein
VNPGDTCTPVYGLPYATGASRPCNIGSTSCDFAAAVENQLNLLDDVVLRTQTSIPMAWVRTKTAFTMTQNAAQNVSVSAPFDTVVVDTDNMADLVAFSPGLTASRSGLFLTWVYVRSTATVNSLGGNNLQVTFFIEPPSAVNNIYFPQVKWEGVNVNQFNRQSVMTVMNIPAGARFGMNLSPNGQPNDAWLISELDMGMMWVGDAP